MSCRVLGRRVEEAILNLLVESANKEGATAIRGRYIPTDRNELVRDHYAKLGFERIETGTANGSGPTEWTLPVAGYEPRFTNLFEMVRTDGPS
jgi:predicted enzyme involved in methoxymalonyl-ACP biosynthesis